MSVTFVLICVMVLIILINTFGVKTESFTDSENKMNNNVLDKVDSMEEKLDNLVEQEKETRTFCKLLRHDSSNKEQLQKMMEFRNQQFDANWKKQNKMLGDIKKKIIELKLGKNNKEFVDFNSTRNKKRGEYSKRKKIMEAAKKMIQNPPQVNLTFQNNI